MIKFSKAASYASLILILLTVKATSRVLHYSASEFISDGTDDQTGEQGSSFLHLKGIDDCPEERCEQMYGFLPCSETLLGHLFLIVVYEYLLYHGESYVSSGGKRIFQILGPGIFGASAFQVLGFLPESLILLVSGILDTKDGGEEYVLTGVGLLAGSAILHLTLLWGICVMIGRQKFSSESVIPTQNLYQKLLSLCTGSGVTTDEETSHAAKIMVLSVIPFTFILIPEILGANLSRVYIFTVALPVSALFLIVYFIYQVLEPSIQKRRLLYVKHEHLVVDILKHLQEHTAETILMEDGSPNLPAIKGLFSKIDQDGDSYITFPELKAYLQEIKFRNLNGSKDRTLEEIMKEFDKDGDGKVTKEEFVQGFTIWLDETKNAVNKRSYRSINSWKDLSQIIRPWVQSNKREKEMMKTLVSEIIRHVQRLPLGNFYNENGTPNISAIKGLFESIDLDKDNFISQSELKRLIMEVDSQKIPENIDEATAKIMQDLDESGDQQIDLQEFIKGVKNWLNSSNDEIIPKSPGAKTDASNWERWMDDDDGVDRSNWAWTKAIMSLVLGIAMLALLAEPLIHSVHNVSTAANIPSFFISFILVPLATNARAAISAIRTARQKKKRTTSLTFSELYDGVFMNNVLGFSVLLAVIYFRGLTWDFSAEVLIVLIVCTIMGTGASFRSKFPVWTSFIAFLLYPLSLVFVYLVNRF